MKTKNLLFLILNTLIVFAPSFRIFPKWTWIVAGIGILFMFDKNIVSKIGCLSKKFWLILVLIMCSTIMSICIPIFYKTYDFTYTPILIGLILCIFRAVFISYIFLKLYKQNASVNKYIEFFVGSCLVYFSFTILFIGFPEFKDFWMNYVIIPVEGSSYIAYKYRYGLDGFAAFGTATIFSLAVLLNSYLLIINKVNKKQFKRRIITYILLCSGCFFYGRISVFAIIISLIYMFVFCSDKKRLGKIILYLVTIFGVAFFGLIQLSKINLEVKIWTDWAFEFIFDLMSGDVGASYSVSHMFEDMYFIPPLKTILFGDGRYKALVGSGYYMSTDVGFMRPLLFFGIIGLSLNYSIIVVLLKQMYAYFKKLKNRPGKMLIIAICCITIILEMKGEAFHRIVYCILPIYFMQCKIIKESRLIHSISKNYKEKN